MRAATNMSAGLGRQASAGRSKTFLGWNEGLGWGTSAGQVPAPGFTAGAAPESRGLALLPIWTVDAALS